MTPPAKPSEPKVFLSLTRDEVAAEIARCLREEEQSKALGCYLDAGAFRGYRQTLQDALDGVKRCHGCGRVMPERGRRRVA